MNDDEFYAAFRWACPYGPVFLADIIEDLERVGYCVEAVPPEAPIALALTVGERCCEVFTKHAKVIVSKNIFRDSGHFPLGDPQCREKVLAYLIDIFEEYKGDHE